MQTNKRSIPRGLMAVRAETGNHAEIKELVEGINTAFAQFKASHRQEVKDLQDAHDKMALQLAGQEMLGRQPRTVPSIGASVTKNLKDNSAFAQLVEWNTGTCRLNTTASVHAALTNQNTAPAGGGYMPNSPEDRGIVVPVQRKLRLLDVLPSRPTARDSVSFVQLNATGDAAEQINEGDEKSEVEFTGTPKTANVVTIAGHTTASRQVLDDFDALSNLINGVLRNKVLSRLENQLINGPGGQGRILGLLAQATALNPSIGTTAADIIGESLVRQADAGYTPNLVIMNPIDWFRIQVTRKNATDDEYVFGSPTMPVPPSLWNTSIVTTPSLAEGSAMTLDTSFTTVLDRQNVSVLISNSHKDYFTRNLVLILSEMRAGLEVLDTLAVQKLTLPAAG